MRRVIETTTRVALTVLLVTAATKYARADQTFGYTSQKPQLWETERPALEDQPGTNLYWHDPYVSSWEMCREWLPSANGCPPTWYVRAEMLALWRDVSDKRPIATLGPAGPVALSTSDFRNEYNAGLRILLGRALGPWYRVEASYFGSYAWDDSVAIRNLDVNDQGGIGDLYSPFSDFGELGGVVGQDYNDFVSIRGQATLNNAELNLRRRLLMRPGKYESSFLLGVRYMDLRERFEYYAEGTTPGPDITSHDLAIRTKNKMIGAQIGLQAQFLFQPRCWMDFEMKGGVYQNRATLDRGYRFIDTGARAAVTTGQDEIDRTSFVGDLSLQLNYQFARHWTFYGGYNAIWVAGVALAAENFEDDYAVLTLGPARIDHSGHGVFHGPNFGLVATY